VAPCHETLQQKQVFFRVSMGIFKQIEEQVMACQSFDAVMERAKGWPRCMVQHNELLKASFQGLDDFTRFESPPKRIAE